MTVTQTVLERLKEYVKEGAYRSAIREYIAHAKGVSAEGHLIDVQYAVALQHAGLFNEALEIYRTVRSACDGDESLFATCGISSADLKYNLDLQEAVLVERLGDRPRARAILASIGPPAGRGDLGIAFASLESWYYITVLKTHRRPDDVVALQKALARCAELAALHPLLDHWGKLFAMLLEIQEGRSQFPARASELRQFCGSVGTVDPPGEPWLLLAVAEAAEESCPVVAAEFARECLRTASVFGKFFLIASGAALLCRCQFRIDPDWPLLEPTVARSLNAYARSQLLMRPPIFREALYAFCSMTGRWSEKDQLNLFLRATGLLVPRDDIRIGRRCVEIGSQARREPSKIFEEFVGDWSEVRFVGRRLSTPEGLPTADTVIARSVCGQTYGTIVQAKLYEKPSASIPKRLYLRDIANRYGLDTVERYVFVVATSHLDGWSAIRWHFQDEERIRNLVPDTKIEVVVVTEPELQTDVVLSELLYFKYFRLDHT